jgi:E3 ubiquitin-protein ligase makorin
VDEDEEEVLAELEALGLLSPDDGGDGADDVARAVAAIDDGHAAGPHDASTPLCGPFTATGACARGDACRRVHGAACERCGKHALHPLNPADAAAHDAECAARAARIAELASSADVECGVCLEVVLSKPRVGDRRFGLLTGCDHAFCLACIRSWRGHADGGGGGLDVDGAVRACPLCRSPSAFVTPSATWPATPEAKAAVIEGYKTALSSIECRHWARGRGVCPFGTSCHYRHVDADGREVDRSAGLRFVGDAEGSVRPMAGVRLSDFLAAGSVGALRALWR